MDLGLHGLLVEQLDVLPEAVEVLGIVPQLHHHRLVDGDVDHTRALVVAVDAVAPDGGLDLVEVLEAEALERRHLVREPLLAVADTVGEAGLHEAAVASAGGRADGATLDQDDVP